ncbi:MAG: glycosylphosphatidylinositol specific phospholipase [Acidimicrobiaceae bacterium]|nr:glycosylphosphatidylinositol specific phospholipase [Acidimicrobiaceae bacterium]
MSEPQLPPSWDGSVVLDIGGEVGALLLRTPSTLNGREIDLDSEDENSPHTHSAVRERRLPGGISYAAVYPGLKAGHYVVSDTGQRVVIVGGRVTEADYDAR